MKLYLQFFVVAAVLVVIAQCQKQTCKENGKPCDRDSDCCSKSCLFYAHKCVYSGPLGPNSNSNPKPVNKDAVENEVVQKIGVPEIKPAKETLDVKKPCIETGKKCFNHEDCCTKRCHSFMHNCVV